MQHDDTIWSVISQGFCSFKAKIRDDVGHAGAKTEAFCRNPYNLTGICSRVNCPLANSQYATIIEKDNELYLYMKTVERAHTPKRLWEKVKLPANFKQALEVINDNLQWWDRKIVMKCKHRLLRLKQILIRKRRLAVRGVPKMVPINKKEEKQLAKKEKKAEKAAKVLTTLEKHLVGRITKEPVDLTEEELIKLANEMEEGEMEGVNEALGPDMDDENLAQYEADSSSEDESDVDSQEDEPEEAEAAAQKGQKRKASAPLRRKRPYVQIEEEKELESSLRKSIDW